MVEKGHVLSRHGKVKRHGRGRERGFWFFREEEGHFLREKKKFEGKKGKKRRKKSFG